MLPAIKPVIVTFILFIGLFAAPPSFAIEYADNPAGDQPDESLLLGNAIFPSRLENISPNIDAKSKVAVLDNGYAREAVLFLGLFLPVRTVAEKDIPSQAPSISLFIIPSGGLSYLADHERFRMAMNKFVEDGGTLFVFSQRSGREYSILPGPAGETIQGYGWLEDQSALSNSALLAMRHPVVDGLTTSRPHLNIDGFFTSFPGKGKPVLRNSISGQAIMLIYRHGKGNVIATTLFTDWAYIHTSITWDEVAIFSRLLKWAGLSLIPAAPKAPEVRAAPVSPVASPAIGFSIQSDNEIYMAGSTATFTINMWNNEDKKRTISVYYDDRGHDVQLSPHGSARLNYSIPVYSTRRLWVYFYDEKKIFLQTLKKGYTVVYPTGEDKDAGKGK